MKKKLITAVIILITLHLTQSCKGTTSPDGGGQDTTSHNFTFERWEFGAHSSSVLYDVAVIDENNIWAVGEIYTEDVYTYDSLGNWQDPYNAIHWNGMEWELKRIYYIHNNINSWTPIYAVYAFGENDIWFGNITHWNGIETESISFNISFASRVNKIWGSSSQDLYIVGDYGNLAHYNGNTWTKLETPSGTENLDIYDIKGFKEGEEYKIYAAAAKHSVNLEKKILKIEGTKVTDLPATGIQYSISGLWGKPGSIYYAVGGGMYKKKEISSTVPWEGFHEGTTRYYIYSIDGQGTNDIVCSGSYGELLHYNGSTWKSYREAPSVSADEFLSVKIKDDIIVSVGYENPKAVIIIGKRK